MYISPQVRDLRITKTWPNYALNIIGRHPEAKDAVRDELAAETNASLAVRS